MEYLLLTQSRPGGKNQMILDDIGKIIQAYDNHSHITKRNFSDLFPSRTESEVRDADTIVMVVPEWNGSIPYMLKQAIDQSGWPSYFKGAEIVLIGTCGSTDSEFEGIKHLRHILNYIGAIVNLDSVLFKGLSNDLPKEHYRSETNHLTQLIQKICSTSISN